MTILINALLTELTSDTLFFRITVVFSVQLLVSIAQAVSLAYNIRQDVSFVVKEISTVTNLSMNYTWMFYLIVQMILN